MDKLSSVSFFLERGYHVTIKVYVPAGTHTAKSCLPQFFNPFLLIKKRRTCMMHILGVLTQYN